MKLDKNFTQGELTMKRRTTQSLTYLLRFHIVGIHFVFWNVKLADPGRHFKGHENVTPLNVDHSFLLDCFVAAP